ncbi:MAG TPA: preprotein translocase subunit SecG [Nitrospiria bacterium]|nr:preprotein translocase subunit SecG [Nitrospiria bacterium]
MLYVLLVIFHLIVSAVLVSVVLLQSGKGAEMGAAFGGSSQTLFGGRGAATFLSKVTVGSAVLFMLTSLSLSVLSRERSVLTSSSVMDSGKKAAEETIPKETGVPVGPDKIPSATNSPSSSSTPVAPPGAGSTTNAAEQPTAPAPPAAPAAPAPSGNK